MKLRTTVLLASALSLVVFAPAFAEDANDIPNPFLQDTSLIEVHKSSQGRQVDTSCIVSAVQKRDDAVIGSVSTYSTAVIEALGTRRDALKSAWSLQDSAKRKQAIKAAWSTFDGTWKKASTAMRQARKDAWSTFKADLKSCKQPMLETTGESRDLGL
jgi:hypothetical protein